jgi:TctA family transporter
MRSSAANRLPPRKLVLQLLAFLRYMAVWTKIWPMVAAAVVVTLIQIWLSSKRVEFGWRIWWLVGAFALVCASSLAAGSRLAGWIAGGIFEAVQGIAHFISTI